MRNASRILLWKAFFELQYKVHNAHFTKKKKNDFKVIGGLLIKVMLKILQARLQQYVNRELPDGQAGFRKGRGTRDQIVNICWIMEKAREFQKKYLFLLY